MDLTNLYDDVNVLGDHFKQPKEQHKWGIIGYDNFRSHEGIVIGTFKLSMVVSMQIFKLAECIYNPTLQDIYIVYDYGDLLLDPVCMRSLKPEKMVWGEQKYLGDDFPFCRAAYKNKWKQHYYGDFCRCHKLATLDALFKFDICGTQVLHSQHLQLVLKVACPNKKMTLTSRLLF
ncbi:uncharacterized protein LOC133777882 [Humulus lupulus]|uniref:uncharacterized protein LOC133777882 n=1 Tax=Humulus lupulus TaxID=3486 RepID=UPI002B41042B|nr:uncharacterized protein LOC133777882 [Humulus lupulus]XP_062073621.1 uncharacterized protein LOC133777882 [Humulus lupulus]